jgi:UDP-glucose 4-epimerase
MLWGGVPTMRILVTGGAGYIGSHCVRELQARGHDVWIYDNLSFGHREAVPGDRLIVADLADADRLDQALIANRIEAVMHFAAFAFVGESVTNPAKYYQNNVVNSLSLFERCRRQGIDKLVFSSTCAVYGTPDSLPITEETPKGPINPYGRTKLIIEMALNDYAAAYGWSFAALRYFNACGAASDGSIGEDHTPETHLIPLVIEAASGKRPFVEILGTDYPTPDGTCIRDYIHVEDLATAHAAAIEKLGSKTRLTCNLGTGRGTSVKEVIASVERVTGKTVPVKLSPRRPGDPAELVASPAKAAAELGWSAKFTEIDRIVASAWEWHRAHPEGFGRGSR